MTVPRKVGIRWTMGDVSCNGFEALRLSIWGAWKLFGPAAAYAVCVNTISVEEAKARAGDLPDEVRWHAVSEDDLPNFLRAHLDAELAEGAAWKLAPLRLFPDQYELSLDNDCILWAQPEALQAWSEDSGTTAACVLAEDVRRGFGQFVDFCGSEPRNAGIRGFPPGFDLGGALRQMLDEHPVVMTSELDEQGLQISALSRAASFDIVRTDEVTICSPIPPHVPHLGRCGAHFVGVNAKELPWELEGRPAVAYLNEHWQRHREALYERVGLGADEGARGVLVEDKCGLLSLPPALSGTV